MVERLVIWLLLLLITGTAGAGHPLEPIDTSSPRATMESFLALTDEAAQRYLAFRDAPSPATQKALWRISEEATPLLYLSRVAPAARRKVADETFYLLWDVMARLELPDLAEMPGATAEGNGDEQDPQPR